jgi:hypothetical protein
MTQNFSDNNQLYGKLFLQYWIISILLLSLIAIKYILRSWFCSKSCEGALGSERLSLPLSTLSSPMITLQFPYIWTLCVAANLVIDVVTVNCTSILLEHVRHMETATLPNCKGALMMDGIQTILAISRTFQPHLFNLYSTGSVLKFISYLTRPYQWLSTGLSRVESKCVWTVWIQTRLCTFSTEVWYKQWHPFQSCFIISSSCNVISLLSHFYLDILHIS